MLIEKRNPWTPLPLVLSDKLLQRTPPPLVLSDKPLQ